MGFRFSMRLSGAYRDSFFPMGYAVFVFQKVKWNTLTASGKEDRGVSANLGSRARVLQFHTPLFLIVNVRSFLRTQGI